MFKMSHPTRANPDEGSSSQDPMVQILQMLVADRGADQAMDINEDLTYHEVPIRILEEVFRTSPTATPSQLWKKLCLRKAAQPQRSFQQHKNNWST